QLCQLPRCRGFIHFFFSRDDCENVVAIRVVTAPTKRVVPNAQELDQQLAVFTCPFATNGKHSSGIFSQDLPVIPPAFVSLGFTFPAPRRSENAGESLAPRHGLQTCSGCPQRNELIIASIKVQAMLQDDPP